MHFSDFMGNIMVEMLRNEANQGADGQVTTTTTLIEQKVGMTFSPMTRDREKWLGVGPKGHEAPHHTRSKE